MTQTIIKAIDYGSLYGYVELTIEDDISNDTYIYPLYPNDEHGDAPTLRQQLEDGVSAGSLTLEPPPSEEPPA